jgi:hypothetical protein
MGKARTGSPSLTNKDASVALGMIARGDREHDIAAWFGVNQARIAEAKAGAHGSVSAAPADQLPPKGPPGVKGRRLRASVQKVLDLLSAKGTEGVAEVEDVLREALKRYETSEA